MTINPLIPETQPQIITNIDTHKVLKYFPRLLNGEAYKLETWLPNMISIGTGFTGIAEREKYDYRLGQFKSKERQKFNSHLTFISQDIDQTKRHKESYELQIQLALDKAEQLKTAMKKQLDIDTQKVMLSFSRLKTAVDEHHEKNREPFY